MAWVIAGLVIFAIGFIAMVLIIGNYKVHDGFIGICVLFMGIGFSLMIYGCMKYTREESDACKAINGEYKVVDTTTTLISTGKTMMPTTIDVYGCVKE